MQQCMLNISHPTPQTPNLTPAHGWSPGLLCDRWDVASPIAYPGPRPGATKSIACSALSIQNPKPETCAQRCG